MTPQEKPERPRLRDGVHYLETPFRARMRMMIEHVARQEAREEVKRRLRAQGVKLSLTSAMTITQLANAHLRAHEAELLAQAERSGAVQRLLAPSAPSWAKSLRHRGFRSGVRGRDNIRDNQLGEIRAKRPTHEVGRFLFLCIAQACSAPSFYRTAIS
jgi:hypothetical protein